MPFVLLHAGDPYVREAGYPTTAYSNDVRLTTTSTVLFSTDAHGIPETYWLAARRGWWGWPVEATALASR